MKTNNAFLANLQLSRMALTKYIADMSDADLFVRIFPDTNHIAWQLGHLICSEHDLLNVVKPDSSPALTDDFKKYHSRDNTKDDNIKHFETQANYLKMLDVQRNATLKVLEGLNAEDFNRPGPAHMQQLLPTVASIFALLATHDSMHAGQFVAIRRKLGKPVVI